MQICSTLIYFTEENLLVIYLSITCESEEVLEIQFFKAFFNKNEKYINLIIKTDITI